MLKFDQCKKSNFLRSYQNFLDIKSRINRTIFCNEVMVKAGMVNTSLRKDFFLFGALLIGTIEPLQYSITWNKMNEYTGICVTYTVLYNAYLNIILIER